MVTRKTQYGWMALGGLVCLFGVVLCCKVYEGNRALAGDEAPPVAEKKPADPAPPPPAKEKDKAEEKGAETKKGDEPPKPPEAPAPSGPAMPMLEPPPAPPAPPAAPKPEGPASAPAPTPPPAVMPDVGPAAATGAGPVPPRGAMWDGSVVPAGHSEPKNEEPKGPVTTPPMTPPAAPPSGLATTPPPSAPSTLTPPPTEAASGTGSATLPTAPVTPPAPSALAPPMPPPAAEPTTGSVPPPATTVTPPPPPKEEAHPMPGEPPLAPAPGPVQSYQVRSPETLRDLARRTMGSADRWSDIHKLNPTLKPEATLAAGTVVRLPGDACVQPDDVEPVKPLPALRPKPPAKAKVVLPLTGTFPCNLDDKKVMTLPKAIRDQLGASDTVLISPGPDKCLWLTNQSHLERLAQRLEQSPAREVDVRVFKRLYFAQTEKTALTADGRVAISERLAQFAGLHQEVVLVGIDDHFELWDAGRWRQYTQQKSAAAKAALADHEHE